MDIVEEARYSGSTEMKSSTSFEVDFKGEKAKNVFVRAAEAFPYPGLEGWSPIMRQNFYDALWAALQFHPVALEHTGRWADGRTP